MLMLISTCGRNSSHNYQGNEYGKPLSMITKFSLKFWIALSAKLQRCMCGGTISYSAPFFLIPSLYFMNLRCLKPVSWWIFLLCSNGQLAAGMCTSFLPLFRSLWSQPFFHFRLFLTVTWCNFCLGVIILVTFQFGRCKRCPCWSIF